MLQQQQQHGPGHEGQVPSQPHRGKGDKEFNVADPAIFYRSDPSVDVGLDPSVLSKKISDI